MILTDFLSQMIFNASMKKNWYLNITNISILVQNWNLNIFTLPTDFCTITFWNKNDTATYDMNLIEQFVIIAFGGRL